MFRRTSEGGVKSLVGACGCLDGARHDNFSPCARQRTTRSSRNTVSLFSLYYILLFVRSTLFLSSLFVRPNSCPLITLHSLNSCPIITLHSLNSVHLITLHSLNSAIPVEDMTTGTAMIYGLVVANGLFQSAELQRTDAFKQCNGWAIRFDVGLGAERVDYQYAGDAPAVTLYVSLFWRSPKFCTGPSTDQTSE